MLADEIPAGWRAALDDHVDTTSFHALERDLAVERARTDTAIYPPEPGVFAALRLTPFGSVRAVILGQDPYYQEGLATGLAFSIPEGCKQPRSLQNILKARHLDLGLPIPSSGSLEHWATSGVLLLNSALTVRRGEANSHRLLWKHGTSMGYNSVVSSIGTNGRISMAPPTSSFGFVADRPSPSRRRTSAPARVRFGRRPRRRARARATR